MFKKIKYFFFLLVLGSGLTFAQLYESLESEAVDVLISLASGNSVSKDDISNLKEILHTDPSVILDSLLNHLINFESELTNVSTDSALVLFNQWYLHLSNTFYPYNKAKFFSSTKKKIILFSTSMSCYCTLEMAKNQTIDIIKFIKENYDGYDYWIIDSFEHNELQIEYMTLFAPSVIVFNADNQVLYKIEYEEKMIVQLTDYFNNNINYK
jgi:hypothetical protein